MTHEEILERDIKAATGAQKVSVVFWPDEIITITVDGKDYSMEIGSDDDAFVFSREGEADIIVPYSDEWLALS